jgi:hypothetical protein
MSGFGVHGLGGSLSITTDAMAAMAGAGQEGSASSSSSSSHALPTSALPQGPALSMAPPILLGSPDRPSGNRDRVYGVSGFADLMSKPKEELDIKELLCDLKVGIYKNSKTLKQMMGWESSYFKSLDSAKELGRQLTEEQYKYGQLEGSVAALTETSYEKGIVVGKTEAVDKAKAACKKMNKTAWMRVKNLEDQVAELTQYHTLFLEEHSRIFDKGLPPRNLLKLQIIKPLRFKREVIVVDDGPAKGPSRGEVSLREPKQKRKRRDQDEAAADEAARAGLSEIASAAQHSAASSASSASVSLGLGKGAKGLMMRRMLLSATPTEERCEDCDKLESECACSGSEDEIEDEDDLEVGAAASSSSSSSSSSRFTGAAQ